MTRCSRCGEPWRDDWQRMPRCVFARVDAVPLITSGVGGHMFDEIDVVDWPALRRLAHSLAIAAALCEAWLLGGNLVEPYERYQAASRWSPGCGRSAP
jgi:hypothetical protein